MEKRPFLPLLSSFFFLLLLSACTPSNKLDHRATPEAASIKSATQIKTAQNAMIVAANPYAVETGYKILRAGGSAVDAAIAAQMVLNLVEPQSSGIGGGGFMLVFDPKSEKVTSYDGRETAPKSVTENLFIKDDGSKMSFFEAIVGGRSVGIPGLLHMLDQAHRDYGLIDWPSLLEEAKILSENGFILSNRLHTLLEKDKFLKNDPIARDYFYDETLNPKPVGTLLKNPAFAKTLEQLQTGGISSFYLGNIADQIVEKVNAHPTNPGEMTSFDMMTYKSIKRDPVCMDYLTYHICGMAPPSSGGLTVLETLGLMEKYDQNNDTKPTINRTHLYLEAAKLAFADRNQFIADPDFVDVPTQELLAPAYLIGRQTLIQHDGTLKTPVDAGGPHLYSHNKWAADGNEHGLSTTHISVIDKNGMIVSMTTSIENAFGARQMVGGFLLNNQLSDFSFLPKKQGLKVANRPEAGKRPRSSMAPTIVLDKETKKPVLIIGSPGGSRIISYVAYATLGLLADNMSLKEVLERGHIANRNGNSELETGTDATNYRKTLEKLGHKVSDKTMTSGLHIIQIKPDGTLIGAADPRREGAVMGY
jgi:gamma-glutamyltranspeptidase/glutathione hydrolase